MFERQYEQLNLNPATQMRMIEIEFYLFFYPIFKHMGKDSYLLGKEYVNLMCRMMDRDPFAINLAYETLRKPHARPTKREIAIFGRYYEISYNDMVEYFPISKGTIMKHVREYIDSDQPTLMPYLSPAITEDLKESMKDIKIHFTPIAGIASVLLKSERRRKG
jgi:hypothetical protein